MNKKIIWAAAVCLIIGTAFIFYYPVREFVYTAEQRKEIAEYRREKSELLEGQNSEDLQETQETQDVQNTQDVQETQSVQDTQDVQNVREMLYPQLYQEIQAYNESIYLSGQEDLKDAWSYEQPSFVMANYGAAEDIFGVLTIPAMDIELPVYLGASADNLSRGAAILGQTSIPTGQENSNCVIAGHRGWPGKPMFREIEQLSVGDRLQLETPWEIQTYEVGEIAVIEPQDVEAIHIQEGKTLLTLITCHPYGQNYNRYVVYCRLVKEESETQAENGSKSDKNRADEALSSGSTPEQETESSAAVSGETWGRTQRTFEKLILFAAIPLIIFAVILLLKLRGR